MTAWSVTLRGIRYRPGRSLVVLLLAVVAIATAVLAPAYTRAAQRSVLHDGLDQALPGARALVASAFGDKSTDTAAVKEKVQARLAARPLLRSRAAGAVITGGEVAVTAPKLPYGPESRLVYRSGVCAHLTIAEGRCPAEPGQVAVSRRTASGEHIAVGQEIELALKDNGGVRPVRYTVTGLYEPKDLADKYWGLKFFFSAGEQGETEHLDAIFTGDEGDLTFAPQLPRGPLLTVEYPLDVTGLGVDEMAPLRTEIEALGSDLRGADVAIESGLPGILRDVATEQAVLARTVPLIALPLVLLCWFVLFLVVASLTEQRGPEIALAKLRGFPIGRATRFGVGEPLLLIVLAAPPGLAAGLGLTEAAGDAVLAPGSHVEVRWPVFAVALVALAGALVAAVAASRRTVSAPVLALLRRVPPRSRARAAVLEGVVIALAAAGLYQVLFAGDRTSAVALVSPPLLALVAGLVAARLLGLAARARIAGARRRGRLPALLAAAQLARRPATARVVAVLTVAVALLSFAVAVWDVAGYNRRLTAQAVVGAGTVYEVIAAHPRALVDAVNKIDPGGHRAMAALHTSGRYDNTDIDLVAVDAARLPDVAVWPGRDRAQVAALADTLRPKRNDPIVLRGPVEVDLAVDALKAVKPPTLALRLVRAGQPPKSVQLGKLATGTHTYRIDLPECADGCRLAGFTLDRAAGSFEPMSASLRISALRDGGKAVDAGLGDATRWRRGELSADSTLEINPGLVVKAATTGSQDLTFFYADSPEEIPVALAGDSLAEDRHADGFAFLALGDKPTRFGVAAHSALLPRARDRGLLFDLDTAVREAEDTTSLADRDHLRYEVWAAPGVTLDRELAAAGLQVTRTTTLDGYTTRLGRMAPALSLRLYLFAGAAAVLLAIGTVLLTSYIGVDQRRHELAALRVTGLPHATLRRALVREHVILLGVPLLAGAVAGLAAAALMIPAVPLVTVGDTLRPVYRVGPLWLPGAGLLMAVAFALVVTVVLRLTGRARPELLRNGAR